MTYCDLEFRDCVLEGDLLLLERLGDEVVAGNVSKHRLCTDLKRVLNDVGALVIAEWVGGGACGIECVLIELLEGESVEPDRFLCQFGSFPCSGEGFLFPNGDEVNEIYDQLVPERFNGFDILITAVFEVGREPVEVRIVIGVQHYCLIDFASLDGGQLPTFIEERNIIFLVFRFCFVEKHENLGICLFNRLVVCYLSSCHVFHAQPFGNCLFINDVGNFLIILVDFLHLSVDFTSTVLWVGGALEDAH